ncbi:conserved hypothetical protein [Methanocella paludicola SANAE]|uniref:Uroporphyrin-III C-methyltransferase n=1 Tax=Methanocella paludicola (strain DSM 17711 / JCM 13418 / NBRC 101707 / SANAE) TaxID=304371 RepID=D1YX08_METPS|nr:DUF488 family protein [Methanocella paludicola]BAI60980.1 conserved hypothetical protein [Methanocella paludicola SANAE]
MIRIKRAYDEAAPEDGFRVLVERLWPRGVTKERAALDLWLKDVSPSTELRKWFHSHPDKWDEFRERYWRELADKKEDIDFLKKKAEEGTVTFIYSAREREHNAATELKAYIEQQARGQ